MRSIASVSGSSDRLGEDPSSGVIWLVARREIGTRAKSKAFRITTAILLIATVATLVVTKLVGGSSPETVGFTATTTSLASPLTSAVAAVGGEISSKEVADENAGRAQVRDGKLDALVVGDPASFHVVVKTELNDDLRGAFTVLARQQALNEQIVAAGGNPEEVNRAVSQASVGVQALQPEKPFHGERLALGMIAGILIYIALMTCGQLVAQGVIEEKANRIVEILLTAIRPWQLMLGKVLGIGLVALAQVALVAVVGAVGALLIGALHLPGSVAIGTAIWTLVWFLIGFLSFATMFAAAGALVSRQEDAGSVTSPLMMLIIVPYVLGISLLPGDPSNGFLRVLSLIPPFSPLLMPMRVALGVPVWESALSVALALALLVVLVWVSGRIYSNAVLRTGTRVRVRDALRAA